MSGSERRRERRYVVDAVHLSVGPQRFPVIDIAASGARISCSPAEFAKLNKSICRLEFGSEPPYEVFAIDPRLIRQQELYIVLGYEAPGPNWEDFIRRYDTFHVHELDAQLFD
ncbi:MAG: hypothetical protein U1E87_00175 [Alphaproteobacteria bacterium]